MAIFSSSKLSLRFYFSLVNYLQNTSFNGVLAEQEIDLQFRKGSDIDVGGFWLS